MRLILFFVLLSNFIFSICSIDIYVGLTECSNCLLAFNSIKELNNYEKIVFINKRDSAVFIELLENYELPRDLKFNYVNYSIETQSYCRVFVQNLQIDSFAFRKLPYKINDLKQLEYYSYFRKVHFPKKLVLNKTRLTIMSNKNDINIYDYSLGKNIYFSIDLAKDSVRSFSELRGNQFGYEAFLKAGNYDTMFYKNTLGVLKKLNMADPRIEGAFINDYSLNLMMNLRYPMHNPHDPNDTMIMSGLFIYHKNTLNGKKALKYVDGTLEFYENNQKKYVFQQNFPFFFSNSGMAFSVYYIKGDKKPSKILSEWQLNSKNQYSFAKFDSFTTSEIQENEFKLNDKYFLINSNFYFNPTLSIIVELKSNKHYDMNGIVLDKENSFCNDIVLRDNVFRALVYTDSLLQLIEYDKKTSKIKCSRKLKVPEGCLINSAKFLNFETIFFLTNDLTAMCFIRPD